MNRLRTVLKWILFALVLAYVWRYGYRLWREKEVRASLNSASIGWLFASAVVYTFAWLPSVWFWRALMGAFGGKVNFRDAARAYYCGHLGKYIPGKALVLVIRSAMVKNRGCPARTGAITAAFETLTMMATGLGVGVLLAPLDEWIHPSQRRAIAVFAVVAGIAALPFVARLFSWIAVKTTPVPGEGVSGRIVVPARLVAWGCAAFLLSWAMHGLSLGLTLHSIQGVPFDLAQWPLWTGATALSMSLGFLVLFAPAGFGVREGILLVVLNGQPGISPQAAVAATVLSRVVSFVAEFGVSAILWTTAQKSDLPNPREPLAESHNGERPNLGERSNPGEWPA